MRRITAGLIITLLLPAAASAKQRPVAPPGNSGVNQYVEVFPTAGGGKPSDSVHPGGSGGGGSGGGGSGTNSSGSHGSGSLSTGTQRALARSGADGQGAAALANATAPAVGAAKSGSGSRSGATNGGGSGGSGSGVQGATAPHGSVSPLTTLVRAITGSNHGGLGPLLPVLLVALALGGGVLALIRRRRAT